MNQGAKNISSAAAPPVGVVRDIRFLAHLKGEDHWESPKRLERVYDMLDRLDGTWPISYLPARLADEQTLQLVHAPAYIRQIADTANYAHSRLTGDTFATEGSFEAASLAAGSVVAAIDAVLEGRARSVFVLARPPGHHAEASRASGFCLFNNVAIGARYARQVKQLSKVLVVDWDVHHGNGIQHIFEQDPAVLYFSSHHYPMFPGTGYFLETGRGAGEGFSINVPLGKNWHDGDYATVYERLLKPVAKAFKPDLILVAAGFDNHAKDPLGKMKVTEQGFAGLTRILMDLAHVCCDDRLVLVLEGGYHGDALASCVKAVLGELCGRTRSNVKQLAATASARRTEPVIQRCIHVLQRFWHF